MVAETSRAVKLCGVEEIDAPSRPLSAGNLSVELQSGNLRYVRFGGIEVIRAISFLVRDENWGTFTPIIDDVEVKEGDSEFAVTYRATCADDKRRLAYRARIEGTNDGRLFFEVDAEAETDVETNRAGFVVLHPLVGVAGRPVRVVHTDGREETDRFPELIAPSQPIFDIRSLAHEIAPGVWAICAMEGDAFEMEDQRNWTDASYKTYVRPLSKPWPYILPKGSRLRQAVRLAIAGQSAAAPRGYTPTVEVALGGESGLRLPSIGIGVPAEEAACALTNLEALRRLNPRHLVCHFDVRNGHGATELDAYRRLAEATGADLVLEVVIVGDRRGDVAAELKSIAAAVAKAGVRPAAVAVSPASDLKSHQPGHEDPNVAPAVSIFAAARAAFPGIRLGGGMFAYFTELNRKRPPAGLLDYITHTTCPIVHAADDHSVLESLEALPSVIASTKAFAGGAAYRVGPSAIGCRANAYGDETFPNPRGGRVCLAARDPRQRGILGAAWTLGYIAAFARGELEAVTIGAPTGPFGFIHRRDVNAAPYFDEAGAGSLYPVFHVIAGLARGSGRPLVDVTVSALNSIEAVAFRIHDRTVLWLANFRAQPTSVALGGSGSGVSRIAVMDASSFEQITRHAEALDALARPWPRGKSIELDAYAVARLDIEN